MSIETGRSVPLADDPVYANVFSFMGLPLSRDIEQVDAALAFEFLYMWASREP